MTTRPKGRPAKGSEPNVPYYEVDRLLVFGEQVADEKGETTVKYPTYDELAKRYGVTHTVIQRYAASHNVLQRREDAKKLVGQIGLKLAGDAVALMADPDMVPGRMGEPQYRKILDAMLLLFYQSALEGRFRADNAADLATVFKVRELVLGRPESRKETVVTLSLAEMQERYRAQMQCYDETTPEMRGEVTPRALPEPVPPDVIDAEVKEVREREPVPAQRAGNEEDEEAAKGASTDPAPLC